MRVMRGKGDVGLALIEALVTLVITSAALLGLMKLAGSAFLQTSESRASVFVSGQMQGMIAAVQGNRAFWTPAAFPTRRIQLHQPSVQGTQDCAAAACSPEDMALSDVGHLRAALMQRLTAPDGEVVCVRATVGVSCIVRLSWEERMAGPTASRRELWLRFLG